MPSHSVGDERPHRELLDALDRLLVEPRRDDEVHPALVVLRRVVVPVGPLKPCETISPGSEAIGSLVAEHAALDLDAVDELLDEHLLVVLERELDRGAQLVVVARLRDPDRRAEPRRLDEDGVAERVLAARRPWRSVTFRVTGIPRSRITALNRSLSMQSAEPSTPAPTYGTPASSSSPCTVPSSPNGPCRTGKTTSTLAERGRHAVAVGHRQRLRPTAASSVAGSPSSQRPSRPISTVTTS